MLDIFFGVWYNRLKFELESSEAFSSYPCGTALMLYGSCQTPAIFLERSLVMFSYIWPIALVVLSNVIYQLCAKETPAAINPLALLTVTYTMGAITSAVLYFTLNRGGNLLREYANLNWVPFVFGVALVGLEVGYIYAYKAGWPVSTAAIVQSSFLTVALLVAGFFLYHEPISLNKVAGIFICMVGLYFINK